MRISIIIPTLNEETTLPALLENLLAEGDPEVIIADGGSSDATPDIARSYRVRIISSEPGRGVQQNAGARQAGGDILLFLHCDTRLPENFAQHVEEVLGLPGTSGGAFRLKIDAPGTGFRLLEWGINLRSGVLTRVYGDQAIFVPRETFHTVGGFPDYPLLEDVALITKLKKQGRIRLAPVPVVTSARRWKKYGLLRTTLMNQIILIGYGCGVSPATLARFYYRK